MTQAVRMTEDDRKFLFDVRDIQVLGRQEGGRQCKCCQLEDAERHQLHLNLMSGSSYRNEADRLGISHVSVHRHVSRHLMPEVLRIIGGEGALIGGGLMHAETVIADLSAARQAMARISVAPATPIYDEDGNLIEHTMRDQINASKTLHSISRTGLELTGHLKRGADVSVTTINASAVEGQVAPIIEKIMGALADHPEAQLAVANALSGGQMIEAKALPVAE